MTILSVALLAHQGGWDEMLMVAAPIALFYGILRIAKRRADSLPDSGSLDSRGEGAESDAGDVGSNS